MEAGRELDALVAEKVMGWKRDGLWFVAPDGSGRWEINSQEALDFVLPRYSTDIAAAWTVIGRFKDFRECARFTIALYEQVRARIGGELSELYLILHVTPADICLAALKAVGG